MGGVIIFGRFGGRSELICLCLEGLSCNISPCKAHFSASLPLIIFAESLIYAG